MELKHELILSYSVRPRGKLPVKIEGLKRQLHCILSIITIIAGGLNFLVVLWIILEIVSSDKNPSLGNLIEVYLTGILLTFGIFWLNSIVKGNQTNYSRP
jgi:hypothetical protein